jgi:hypothetical protein
MPRISNPTATIVGAIIALLGTLIVVYFTFIRKPNIPEPKYLTGLVTNAATTKSVRDAEVQVLVPQTYFFNKAVTDQDGKYRVEIPTDVASVTVKVSVDGYRTYDRSVSAISPNDISLEPLPLTLGIPDGYALESDLQILARTFAITILFTRDCTKQAKANKVRGVQLEADRNKLEDLIRALLARVEANEPRYKVNVLESGRRYEVVCY